MKRLILIALALVSVSVAGLAVTHASPAFADAKSDLCAGANAATGATGCGDTSATISKTLKNIVNLFSSIIGIVAVIMIMLGGFRYVTAGGESGKVSSAKTTIVYAIVGLVIVALSQSLVHFVLNRTAA